METIKQEYRKFFKDNFHGLRLRKPLFYSWHIGLRFNLQVGETDTDEYFQEVNRRASTIFRSAFENSDTTFFMFMDYKYKRRKINFKNFLFKQIHQLATTEVIYTKEKMLYDIDPRFNIMNVSFIKLKTERINYENIIAAIAHKDFPSRQPRLDKRGVFSDKEVYFVNLDKKLVLHMYDDRGLDIISSDKEILRPIYLKYSDWLLDYDRKTMDEIFGQKNAL